MWIFESPMLVFMKLRDVVSAESDRGFMHIVARCSNPGLLHAT